MALVDLVMPKLGESIMEATILKWHKQPGDKVKQDETVLEIATDKVDSEVPSTAEGIIEEILFNVNDVVPIGSVIAKIRTEVSEKVPEKAYAPQEKRIPVQQEASVSLSSDSQSEKSLKPQYNKVSGQNGTNSNGSANRFYSPLVLNIAASEGISMTELESIHGTGNEGRVTKKDILHYVSERKQVHGKAKYETTGNQFFSEPISSSQIQDQRFQAADESFAETKTPEFIHGGNVEIIEMDRMRRLIAEHMVRSKHTSPHVTSFTEADVTNLVLWREKIKNEFEKREGTKITFTPLFLEAIIRCIKKYPIINSSVEKDKIIIKKDIHMGMATALPNGNLIVPVIKNADQFNLIGLTKQVNNLAENARNNRLRPEDIQGGTFTMTNVGIFGSLMGTPIINQPQVAILAVGAIKKRPVVIETSQGDSIAIRHMMYLSLSYDHRVVDGSIGASFLSDVAKEFENFNLRREF